MYDTVKDLSGTCAQKVLTQARLLLQQSGSKIPLGHRWPTNNRRLRTRILEQAGRFWDNVTFESFIDLQQFDLPVRKVKFTFIDPLYVWLNQANLLCKNGHELHWTPLRMKNPQSDEDVYGAGVQFGLLLRAATSSIPECGRVALMNLSWDGGDTGYASRGATPICMQVMNVNSTVAASVGLVTYMPHLEVSDAIRETDKFKNAYFYLLQVKQHLISKNAHLIF